MEWSGDDYTENIFIDPKQVGSNVQKDNERVMLNGDILRVELFNHLKNNPENILKDPFSQRPVLDPDFLSIYLDFGRDMELGIYDNNLTADSVIALRIAFKFFIDGGSYEMDFNGFRQNIYGLFNVNDTIKSLAKFEYIMNLNHVIQSIRESRQLKDNQILPPY
uniref:Uncharacterized protein n=1 Tax=Rhizophagus irregularis (strain DAOM 181602 / DAOM 197198 / MUCL 43194) TaxID=747089 RepID=U9TW71_RHIID